MNNGRDCEHGRQVGKCDTCDLIEAEKLINELEQENVALKVQVEQLRIAALNAISFMSGGKAKADLRDVYDSAPAQCLAEHDAVVAKDAIVSALRIYGSPELSEKDINTLAMSYANQLRKQAKGDL